MLYRFVTHTVCLYIYITACYAICTCANYYTLWPESKNLNTTNTFYFISNVFNIRYLYIIENSVNSEINFHYLVLGHRTRKCCLSFTHARHRYHISVQYNSFNTVLAVMILEWIDLSYNVNVRLSSRVDFHRYFYF